MAVFAHESLAIDVGTHSKLPLSVCGYDLVLQDMA